MRRYLTELNIVRCCPALIVVPGGEGADTSGRCMCKFAYRAGGTVQLFITLLLSSLQRKVVPIFSFGYISTLLNLVL